MKKKRLTLTEIYLHYNYPCNDQEIINSGTIPLPYVKKKDCICDHKFTLTYQDWLTIMKAYLDEFFNVLLEGVEIRLPLMLGKWQIRKYRSDSAFNINYEKLKKEGVLEEELRRNPLIGNHSLKIKWTKEGKYTKFAFRDHWSTNFIRGRWHKIYADLDDNPSAIYKFTDD